MAAAVRTQQLSKRYGHTVALEHLDLEIESGTVFGYLGPNGAGKSTTIALLLGLIRPTAGAAQIFGLDVVRDAPEIHRRLAYVPSEANLWPSLTGAEVLSFLAAIHGSVDGATATSWWSGSTSRPTARSVPSVTATARKCS